MHPLDVMDDLENYRRLFTSLDLWEPYVRAVCARHGLPCERVRTGLPGTCPVFLVDRRWVVKFFGRLFDGEASFAAEREANRLSALDPRIRAAKLAAAGELGAPAWPWPYLVFEYIEGSHFGAVRAQVSPEDRLGSARMLGESVRAIHALPLDGSPVFPNSYEPYLRFLAGQRAGVVERQRGWGSLPERLVAQIDGYLPPVEALVDRGRPPHMIHADLTADHLLGQFVNGRWRGLAVIDFGDAMTGDLLYELAALHLDCFGSDRRMLAAFLDAYRVPGERRAALPRLALSTALLHRFDVFVNAPPEALAADRLQDLADMLWAAAG